MKELPKVYFEIFGDMIEMKKALEYYARGNDGMIAKGALLKAKENLDFQGMFLGVNDVQKN